MEDLDPDNDNFVITVEDAELLNKNMNMLTFIRKNILSSNAKLFLTAIPSIKSAKYDLPKEWQVDVHDKDLLFTVINKGFKALESLLETSDFNGMKLTIDDLQLRLNFLCEFFKDYTSSTKTKKKKELITIQNELLNNQLNPSSGAINLSAIAKKKLSKVSFS